MKVLCVEELASTWMENRRSGVEVVVLLLVALSFSHHFFCFHFPVLPSLFFAVLLHSSFYCLLCSLLSSLSSLFSYSFSFCLLLIVLFRRRFVNKLLLLGVFIFYLSERKKERATARDMDRERVRKSEKE